MTIQLFGYTISIKKCEHKNLVFIENIYGERINLESTRHHIVRSLWRCKDCGKIIKSGELNLNACCSTKYK